MNTNQILSKTKTARAYAAVEMGHFDMALHLLRDAATYAWLAGDVARHAACVKARAQVAVAIGVRHLSAVEG